MTLKDFSTEQLEFIKSRFTSMYALEEFINRRKNSETPKIGINVNDCFYEELGSGVFTLYRIGNVVKTKNIVDYDEIILDINQIYADTYDGIELKNCNFHEMKRLDLNTFNKIWQKINNYNETVNELHRETYVESINLLEEMIEKNEQQ